MYCNENCYFDFCLGMYGLLRPCTSAENVQNNGLEDNFICFNGCWKGGGRRLLLGAPSLPSLDTQPVGVYQLWLFADGTIGMRYPQMAGSVYALGYGASIGLQNTGGTIGTQYRTAKQVKLARGFPITGVAPQASSVVQLLFTPAAAGAYALANWTNAPDQLLLTEGQPREPILVDQYYISPTATTQVFSWAKATGSADAASYTFILANNSNFFTPSVIKTGITTLSYTADAQSTLGTFYWRVLACDVSGNCLSSNPSSFSTVAPSPLPALSGVIFSNGYLVRT
jgi:hypothetical protein